MGGRRLGNSGLRVSRIALGCMSFGDTSRGFVGPWERRGTVLQATVSSATFWRIYVGDVGETGAVGRPAVHDAGSLPSEGLDQRLQSLPHRRRGPA